MMRIWIPLVVGLISFAVFYTLGVLTGKWLREAKPACRHQWSVLLEKYPTFTQDWWKCSTCGLTQKFPHDEPPIPTEKQVCNMGHIHIIEHPEWDGWPDVVGRQ